MPLMTIWPLIGFTFSAYHIYGIQIEKEQRSQELWHNVSMPFVNKLNLAAVIISGVLGVFWWLAHCLLLLYVVVVLVEIHALNADMKVRANFHTNCHYPFFSLISINCSIYKLIKVIVYVNLQNDANLCQVAVLKHYMSIHYKLLLMFDRLVIDLKPFLIVCISSNSMLLLLHLYWLSVHSADSRVSAGIYILGSNVFNIVFSSLVVICMISYLSVAFVIGYVKDMIVSINLASPTRDNLLINRWQLDEKYCNELNLVVLLDR